MRYLVPVREAAISAGVTARTMHRWVRTGLVVSIRLGPRKTLIDLDSVEQVLTKRSDVA